MPVGGALAVFVSVSESVSVSVSVSGAGTGAGVPPSVRASAASTRPSAARPPRSEHPASNASRYPNNVGSGPSSSTGSTSDGSSFAGVLTWRLTG